MSNGIGANASGLQQNVNQRFFPKNTYQELGDASRGANQKYQRNSTEDCQVGTAI
jgi:hypothetical protein